MLREVGGRDAVELCEPRRGQRGSRRDHCEQHTAVRRPLDTVGHAHISDTNYPDLVCPRNSERSRRYDPAMASADEAQLLPDADQRKLLGATLERVNRATNAARATALQRNVVSGAELRDLVKQEVTRAKLPDGFVTPTLQRLEVSLRRRAGKQSKFSTYQSLTL